MCKSNVQLLDMETPWVTYMGGGANYVHHRVNIQIYIFLIDRHVGAKTNINKLFGVEKHVVW